MTTRFAVALLVAIGVVAACRAADKRPLLSPGLLNTLPKAEDTQLPGLAQPNPQPKAAGPAKAAPTLRTGNLVLSGNTRTTDAAILRELTFYPGQPLPSREELLLVELKLLMKFHRRFDLDAGDRPRIEVIAYDYSGYHDIKITFPEKPSRKAAK